MRSGGEQQRAVSLQVPERRLPLSEVLVDPRQVVMRVGQLRVGFERGEVRLDRLGKPLEVLESDAEVESRGRVISLPRGRSPNNWSYVRFSLMMYNTCLKTEGSPSAITSLMLIPLS